MHRTMNVLDVTLALVGPDVGPREGETVPEGKVGLLIQSGNDSLLVIGTAQQLRDRVVEGLSLPIPDGVSLFDAEEV